MTQVRMLSVEWMLRYTPLEKLWFKQYFTNKAFQTVIQLQAYGIGSDSKQVLLLKSSPARETLMQNFDVIPLT